MNTPCSLFMHGVFIREKHFPCIVYSYLMIPPTDKVTTMIFEEHVVTQEKWHRSYSWQMTLRLGLIEPPVSVDQKHISYPFQVSPRLY